MGHCWRSLWATSDVGGGTARSRTSKVLAMAKMPSLNASILAVRRLNSRRRSGGPLSLSFTGLSVRITVEVQRGEPADALAGDGADEAAARLPSGPAAMPDGHGPGSGSWRM